LATPELLFRDIKEVGRLEQDFAADTFVTQHISHLFSNFSAMAAAFASNGNNGHTNDFPSWGVY